VITFCLFILPFFRSERFPPPSPLRASSCAVDFIFLPKDKWFVPVCFPLPLTCPFHLHLLLSSVYRLGLPPSRLEACSPTAPPLLNVFLLFWPKFTSSFPPLFSLFSLVHYLLLWSGLLLLVRLFFFILWTYLGGLLFLSNNKGMFSPPLLTSDSRITFSCHHSFEFARVFFFNRVPAGTRIGRGRVFGVSPFFPPLLESD